MRHTDSVFKGFICTLPSHLLLILSTCQWLAYLLSSFFFFEGKNAANLSIVNCRSLESELNPKTMNLELLGTVFMYLIWQPMKKIIFPRSGNTFDRKASCKLQWSYISEAMLSSWSGWDVIPLSTPWFHPHMKLYLFLNADGSMLWCWCIQSRFMATATAEFCSSGLELVNVYWTCSDSFIACM